MVANAPSLSITSDRPFDITSGWWDAPVTLQITADDATSGILSTEYDLSMAGWMAGNSVTLSADGAYELDAQAIDHVGNITYDGVVIPIDKHPTHLDGRII